MKIIETQTKLQIYIYIYIETNWVYEIGCKIDSRPPIQFTKPVNSNYHSSTENDHVLKNQSMSLELVQSN